MSVMPLDMLRVERKDQENTTPELRTPGGGVVMMTPAIDEDYWSYRVVLSERQAIIGFPKFSTIGIGFAVEEDWNTNLPYTVDAEKIFDHISHNKGDDNIPDAHCFQAILLIQDAVREDREDE